MTERERAFVINGYAEFVRVKDNLSSREGESLVSFATEYAGIPVDLVSRAQAESCAFVEVINRAYRWPLIGWLLALRAYVRAERRGAITMTERERALVVDWWGRILEARSQMPHSKATATVASVGSKVGIWPQLIFEMSQESTGYILDLGAVINSA